jgi:hypothetical protein
MKRKLKRIASPVNINASPHFGRTSTVAELENLLPQRQLTADEVIRFKQAQKRMMVPAARTWYPDLFERAKIVLKPGDKAYKIAIELTDYTQLKTKFREIRNTLAIFKNYNDSLSKEDLKFTEDFYNLVINLFNKIEVAYKNKPHELSPKLLIESAKTVNTSAKTVIEKNEKQLGYKKALTAYAAAGELFLLHDLIFRKSDNSTHYNLVTQAMAESDSYSTILIKAKEFFAKKIDLTYAKSIISALLKHGAQSSQFLPTKAGDRMAINYQTISEFHGVLYPKDTSPISSAAQPLGTTPIKVYQAFYIPEPPTLKEQAAQVLTKVVDGVKGFFGGMGRALFGSR